MNKKAAGPLSIPGCVGCALIGFKFPVNLLFLYLRRLKPFLEIKTQRDE